MNWAVPMPPRERLAGTGRTSPARTRGSGTNRRRNSWGWSSRGASLLERRPTPVRSERSGRSATGRTGHATAHLASVLVPVLPPVLGEDVVQHVVDGDRAEEASLAVDHRARRRGCRSRASGSPAPAGASTGIGSIPRSTTDPTEECGGSRSRRWMWTTPMKRPVGCLERRSADEDRRRQGRARAPRAGQRRGPRRSWPPDRGSPARWSSGRRRSSRRRPAAAAEALPRRAP